MAGENLRIFPALLGSLEDGQLAADLSEDLHRLNLSLIKHAELVGKAKGEIVLKLKFSADAGGTMLIDADVKVKEPNHIRARSMSWLTKDGHLTGANPKQLLLGVREVPKAAEARDVPDATGNNGSKH